MIALRMAHKALILAAVLYLLVAPNNAFASDGSRILSAAEVAIKDFKTRLDNESTSTSEWEFSKFVFDIENYNIGLSQDRDHFVVVFLLRRHGNDVIKGGGGEYWVNKSDLRIARFQGYE